MVVSDALTSRPRLSMASYRYVRVTVAPHGKACPPTSDAFPVTSTSPAQISPQVASPLGMWSGVE